MYKFEKKFLFIIAAAAIFLIFSGILIYFSVSESDTGEEEYIEPKESTREEREAILKKSSSDAGDSRFSSEEREEILKSLSAPKK